MEIPGTTLPIRFIPATVLVAALAACQPETPAVPQPAAAAGVPSVVALFDGREEGIHIGAHNYRIHLALLYPIND